MTAAATSRAGFVGLAGRPNVGKSTLANAIVGAKVAIVSERPQTTRRAVRAVATDPRGAWQMVLVDLPGVQRPRDVLTERMQRRVEHELADADAVLLVTDARHGVGPGDRFIAKALLDARGETPVIAAVNKMDRLKRPLVAAALAAVDELGVADEIFPISARTGAGIPPLVDRLTQLLPTGPLLYPPEETTDLARDVRLAELIREQVLRRTREEVPHSVEVVVEELRRDGDMTKIAAEIWVESESQKGIVIGAGGRMVRAIGTAARRELERELGTRVFLDLAVKLRKRWRRDEALLDRLGID